MSTLRLPPDEFDIVRRAAAILQGHDVPCWPAPDELREFLSEHVTVVKPGETLVIRADDLTPKQQNEYQDSLAAAFEAGIIPFRAVMVHGAELGVVQAASAP